MRNENGYVGVYVSACGPRKAGVYVCICVSVCTRNQHGSLMGLSRVCDGSARVCDGRRVHVSYEEEDACVMTLLGMQGSVMGLQGSVMGL